MRSVVIPSRWKIAALSVCLCGLFHLGLMPTRLPAQQGEGTREASSSHRTAARDLGNDSTIKVRYVDQEGIDSPARDVLPVPEPAAALPTPAVVEVGEPWPVTEQVLGPCGYDHSPPGWHVLGRAWAKWHTHGKPCLQASHWGYPEEFHEPPFGAGVIPHFRAMAANGLADQMVLYHYDFQQGPPPRLGHLKPRGHYQLHKMLKRLGHPLLQGCPTVIVIEQTVGRPDVDAARRTAVLQALQAMAAPIIPEQVVVGRPKTAGLTASESLGIYGNMLEMMNSGRSAQGLNTGSSDSSALTGTIGIGR